MAIYHLTMKIIKRSAGKSAVGAAAYRRAAKLFDEREEKYWNYESKPDVVHSELLIPDNAPAWVKSLYALHEEEPNQAAELLWNFVEKTEKRVDSQLSREIEFALPVELDLDQNILLAREFIKDQLVSRGMIADWSIHWDEGNPHIHVMLTMRHLTEEGFGKRAYEWNSRALLGELREKWAEYANFHLRLHQHDIRIDHRSYKDQGIDLVPTIHQGKAVSDMDKRGIQTDIMKEANAIRRENLSRISAEPKVLLNKMSKQSDTFSAEQLGQEMGRYINDRGRFSVNEKSILSEGIFNNLENFENEVCHQGVLTPSTIAKILKSIEHHESVFQEKDLAIALEPYTENAAHFAKAMVELKASPELLFIGAGDDGRDRFTTSTMFKTENEIQELADKMRETAHVRIAMNKINNVLKKYQADIGKELTDEQLTAVQHILKPTSISCIVGRAGTGKSFSLGAANEVWKAQGLRVYGIALSGIAADGLDKDAKISSRTIESFRYAIEQGTIQLSRNDVIVMDEAGMSDSLSMLSVLIAVREARAKLVLVGDHAQIQPVGPGASFRALLERLGFAEIQTVYRQQEQWQRDATVAFSAGRVAEALKAYEEKSCIHLERNEHDTMAKLVNDWLDTRALTNKAMKEYLVIAHRNEDVNLLNKLLRTERVERGEIAQGYTVNSKSGDMLIAQGDRILFLKNDRQLGVKNGRFATINSVDFTESGKVSSFTVLLDGNEKEVVVNPNAYCDFTYGYAATVHKTQGMTVDHSFVYAGGKSWNRQLAYVAMSRHRHSCHLYADYGTHETQKALVKQLSRLGIKDSLLDFPLAFAERRSIDTSSLSKILPRHLAERIAAFKDKVVDQYEKYKQPDRYFKRKEEIAREKLKINTIQVRREDARRVAAYVDANREVGLAWQAVEKKLHALGMEKISYVGDEGTLIAQTAEYKLFQAALILRNEKASIIMKEPDRYTKAIEIYDLDLIKLKSQAESHQCRVNVQKYSELKASGRTVYRDKQAALISATIKDHYPHLKALGIDTGLLRQEALRHLRRQLFTTLSSAERRSFYVVEEYTSKVKQIGSHYNTHLKDKRDEKNEAKGKNQTPEIIAREHIITFNTLCLERDKLAHQILNHRAEYDQALDFYQIGLATPHFQEAAPTAEQCKLAEGRWYKLQDYAARYELRERVTQYFHASQHGLVSERLKLAMEIRQETKAHYAAMMQLGIRPEHDFWLTLWKDEERFKQLEFFKTLDLVERAAFLTVESYVEAKQSNAAAWRELFEVKKIQQMDDASFYKQLAGFAKHYTKARNALAAEVTANLSAYESSLAYFKINANELNAPAYTHQCQTHVNQFINHPSVLKRAEIATLIIKDPKAYYKAMVEQGIEWKDVYHFARIAERQALFNQSSQEEKRLMRLIHEYRHANKQVGKYYSGLSDQKNGKKAYNDYHNKEKMQSFIAKRDALAYRLINIKENISIMSLVGNYQMTQTVDEYLEKSRFTLSASSMWDKVAKHAQQHATRKQDVVAWHDDYSQSMNHLASIFSISSSNGSINGREVMSRILDWSTDRQDRKIDLLTQKILSQGKAYQVVLQEVGISLDKLTQQQNAVIKIKSALNDWINLESRKENKEAINQSKNLLSMEDKKRLDAVRTIVRHSKPVNGTLAERYLREHRGIQIELNTKTFLYHPNLQNWMTKSFHPALIVLARDEENKVCGLQAIFIDPITAKKATLGEFAKLSRGFTSEGALVQRGTSDGKTAFAEGPETALSIAQAKPDWNVYVTFGVRNFDKVPLKTHANSVVICADNDGPYSGTEKSVEEATKKLANQGIEVLVAMPNKPAHLKKWDFNDSLTAYGVNQVIKDLDEAKLNKLAVTAERLENIVIQTTANLAKKQHSLSDELNKNEVRILDMYDLNSILKRYVEMEIHQTKLVNEMHAARMKDHKVHKELSMKIIQHNSVIIELAKKAVKHPDVAREIDGLKGIKPATIAQRGGYTEISHRFAKVEFLKDDINAVIAQIRNKALTQAHSQEQDRSRGSRTH